MDTSDPDIEFDADGVCNHCRNFDSVTQPAWNNGSDNGKQLEERLSRIRALAGNAEYDCILGLSGGVDSSYLAIKVKEFNLRPLVVHVDAGWNSELAVNNIEVVCKYCNFELHTHVIDWNEMRDLQRAYFKSGVSNQDVPQDHAFFASLYHYAMQNNICTILSGGNVATESVFPSAWQGANIDAINLHAIHNAHGDLKLKNYKTIKFWQAYFWYPMVKKMWVPRLLDLMSYDKTEALKLLETVGWRSYERKHGESVFTKFFQNYYLPTKFGYDKRKPHYSSLILANQLDRETAIKNLDTQLYDPVELEEDIDYFCKKLGFSRIEFDEIMAAPTRSHLDYPNWKNRYERLKKIQVTAEKLLGRKIKVYS